MKSFEDRQKGFEAAFQRDQELAFRITARRNRLFGLWRRNGWVSPPGMLPRATPKPSSRQISRRRATMMLSGRYAVTSPKRASL